MINGCYSKTTGALRVIDSGKSCTSAERKLNWNQTGARGPAGPSSLDSVPCAITGASGELTTRVDPTNASVTLVCADRITVKSTLTLTRVTVRSGPLLTDVQECGPATLCVLRVALMTPNVIVEIQGTGPFHYTCPGQGPQGNYFDVGHTITLGQCTLAPLTKDVTITVTA